MSFGGFRRGENPKNGKHDTLLGCWYLLEDIGFWMVNTIVRAFDRLGNFLRRR
jgi:hypothetical protein